MKKLMMIAVMVLVSSSVWATSLSGDKDLICEKIATFYAWENTELEQAVAGVIPQLRQDYLAYPISQIEFSVDRLSQYLDWVREQRCDEIAFVAKQPEGSKFIKDGILQFGYCRAIDDKIITLSMHQTVWTPINGDNPRGYLVSLTEYALRNQHKTALNFISLYTATDVSEITVERVAALTDEEIEAGQKRAEQFNSIFGKLIKLQQKRRQTLCH